MKRIFTLASLATLALAASAAGTQLVPCKDTKLFPHSRPATAQMHVDGSCGSPLKTEDSKQRVRAVTSPEQFLLAQCDDAGYLDGPDGSTWYYTCDWDYDSIEHEYYTETMIKGFHLHVYDASFTEVGTIDDTITLEPGETKVAAVQIGTQVTTKFFNVDSNYEIMVCVATNTSQYVNNYRTRVYSLGKEGVVTTIPGYYVSAINTATDDWSEKYWITFATEEDTTRPEINGVTNVMDNVFTTWKSAGYGGLGDPAITIRVPQLLLAGENAIPFMSKAHNGKPWFASVMLKKCYYEDPFDYTNENLTPDNELEVQLYTLGDGYGAAVEPYSMTRIPTSSNIEDHQFIYVGNFSYDNDISFDRYTTDGAPSLIVTRESWIPATDSYLYAYDVRTTAPKGTDAQAQPILTLCENTEGGYFMSDLRGIDPQIMFIKNNGSNYYFEFVNLLNGEVEHVLDQYVADDVMITASTQRVAHGDSYLYVTSQTTGDFDEDGNCLHGIVYVTPDGEIDHIDRINLGQGVGYAMVYMGDDALNPFVFNLDDTMEYMALVKRYDNLQTMTGTLHEELIVAPTGEKGQPIFCIGPDSEKGNLAHIWLSNLEGETPVLGVIYNNNYRYTTVGYPLPLTTFTAGDGSIENPYLISTIGEFNYISRLPEAHYRLTGDIDAGGYTLKKESFPFSGSLDGQGHTISNLYVEGRAMFPQLVRGEGASDECGVIRDLNLADVHFHPTVDTQGIVVGSMMNTRVRGVHLYDCDITGQGDLTVGGIAGRAALGSAIERSSLEGASISVPGASVGGIVGSTRTGATVKACAFSGTIAAGEATGGIVGALENADDRVADCHVNASITGDNNVGGVAGTSARGLISNCHVQSSLSATTEPRWGGGPALGGIVGHLDPYFSDDPNAEVPAAIKGNFVNLTAMNTFPATATEEFEGQNDSMHRVAGWTVVNSEPIPTGYDADWNPIYGEPNKPDLGIVDNHVISTLTAIGEKGADTVEGADVETSALGAEFFTTLGFNYGNETDAPWSQTGDLTSPRLWYEGGLLLFTPAAVSLPVGDNASLTLTLKGARLTEDMIESFTCDIADESVIEMTDVAVEGETIVITVSALKEGISTVSASIGGNTAVCLVNVTKGSSVAAVNADSTLTLTGTTLMAAGCGIEVFNMQGMRVLSGHDRLDTAHLPSGIYVAGASDGSRRSTLKFRVK